MSWSWLIFQCPAFQWRKCGHSCSTYHVQLGFQFEIILFIYLLKLITILHFRVGNASMYIKYLRIFNKAISSCNELWYLLFPWTLIYKIFLIILAPHAWAPIGKEVFFSKFLIHCNAVSLSTNWKTIRSIFWCFSLLFFYSWNREFPKKFPAIYFSIHFLKKTRKKITNLCCIFYSL